MLQGDETHTKGILLMSLLELFCDIDDFWQEFEPQWYQELLTTGLKQRQRRGRLYESEIMTILVYFHQLRFRDFKTYYTRYVQQHLRGEFPKLVSYNRFVQLIPSVIVPLCAYLHRCYGKCTGLAFIDATPLRVCHNRRIDQHQVFDRLAARGRSSVGWFFGFKLHIVVKDRGELLACCVTPGNTDDRQPVDKLTQTLFGKLIGDKGYISQALFAQLFERGLQLITKLRSNMKNRLIPLADKALLRKRAIVESIYDQLKNISQIEHSRHRSITGFMANLLAGLIAYCHQPKKPSLHLDALPLLEPLIQN
jgi:hypothetical protein